ncbi:MAG: histidine kinase [Betaproteobacteria bacterium]|nr:histidine kinase [Betaproteobacteria bacterium]MBU6511002.1 histidine kinase [Betaproteobacteria bacterium]MDE1957237.1 histidine kinase [Betaproteobacteria bacterium]MDE2150760.1 histidine kinase [Betaproteobacteria bacterium]MDE2479381.1 histidine kinase [Betaproteobacteria bacterium]
MDQAGIVLTPSRGDARAAADLCSAGAALRALALANLAALALGFGAGATPAAWETALLHDLAVAQPAVALWLLLLCGGAGLWRGARRQAAVAVAWGAAAPWLVEAALAWARSDALPDWRGAALGALLGALLLQHQRLRVQALDPAQVRARLDELQARIRPHFLYNALNAAAALVHEQPERAEQVLDDLAALFRASVGRGGQLSSVREEIELARRYLDIEDVRFGPRMRLAWEVDEACLDLRMPTLTLQPLLENAVRHGVESSSRPCGIDVGIRRRGAHLEIDVRNDYTPRGADTRHSGTGVALANIGQRLRLLYDLEAEIRHGPLRGAEPGSERWRVRLRLPLGPA